MWVYLLSVTLQDYITKENRNITGFKKEKTTVFCYYE